MLNKTLVCVFAAGLIIQLGGCSSSKSGSDQANQADLDANENPDLSAAGSAGQPEGDILADLGGDQKQSADAAAALPDEAIKDNGQSKTTDTKDTSNSKSQAQSGDSTSGGTDLFGSAGTEASSDAPKPVASLKKVKDKPFKVGKTLANTVYIARDGDTWPSVSKKLDRPEKELKKISSIQRKLKVGDKVYYNSAKRPDDAERMVTYYEDNGFPEQIYTAKQGEDLKQVAKNLLGNKDSWKELWVTNPIESKGTLEDGTSLRYWPNTTDVATQSPPPIQEPSTPDLPPPPDMNGGTGMGSTKGTEPTAAEVPPAPPSSPPAVVEPPPAAKPSLKSAKKNDGFVIPGMSQDETFIAGGLVLAIVLAGSILVIKRNRSRGLSSNTQI